MESTPIKFEYEERKSSYVNASHDIEMGTSESANETNISWGTKGRFMEAVSLKTAQKR